MKTIFICFLVFVTVSLSSCAVTNASRNDAKEITVLSYNIHHANPPSKPGLIDIDAIVRVIKDSKADIVALQEVDVMTKRSGKIDQAEQIAQKLGFNYYFYKAIDYDGGDYGLAILSRLPIRNAQTHRLPQVKQTEERILALAQVKVGREWINIANTHLDASRDPANRLVQMQEIVDITAQLREPVILFGDMNATPDSETIQIMDRMYTRTCLDDCQPTSPQVNPRRTIDFIASHGLDWQQTSIEVIAERYASDHLPVKVVFDTTRK